MLDFTRPITTRAGLKVRIFTTDAEGEYSVVGQIAGSSGITRWTKTGYCSVDRTQEHPYDLINEPKERTAFINVYPVGTQKDSMHATLVDAELAAGSKRLKCVEIKYEV